MGCRLRAAKADLLRVVAVEDQGTVRLVVDPTGRLPGRGAHLHPVAACVQLAERRRAFARALRLAVPPDVGPVRAHVDSSTATDPPPPPPSHESRSIDPMSPR